MEDQCLLLRSWTEKGDTSQLWRCFLESSTTKASLLFASSHWHPPWYFESPSSLPGLQCSTQTCKTNQTLRHSPKALQSSSPWFISSPGNCSCFLFTLGQQLLLIEYTYVNYWISSFTCIASFWWFTHNYLHSKKMRKRAQREVKKLAWSPRFWTEDRLKFRSLDSHPCSQWVYLCFLCEKTVTSLFLLPLRSSTFRFFFFYQQHCWASKFTPVEDSFWGTGFS